MKYYGTTERKTGLDRNHAEKLTKLPPNPVLDLQFYGFAIMQLYDRVADLCMYLFAEIYARLASIALFNHHSASAPFHRRQPSFPACRPATLEQYTVGGDVGIVFIIFHRQMRTFLFTRGITQSAI